MAGKQQVTDEVAALVLDLYRIGAVKFGSFTLKSGVVSPIYIDLRVSVSHPKVLRQISEQLLKATSSCNYDVLCGVPYTALPFATLMSSLADKPMLMRRKEAKKYGTKKIIEGNIVAGNRCLVVEDLVTSGMSVFETITPLEDEKLIVQDVVVLLDREQGGRKNIENRRKNLYSVLTLSQVLDILHQKGLVEKSIVESVASFLAANQVKIAAAEAPKEVTIAAYPTFEDRMSVAGHPISKKLFTIMVNKKSNLCVAADVTTAVELLGLAEACGPSICCLKTHCDIVSDWTSETAASLKKLAETHQFLIFEDRKFADIGSTVVNQCNAGHYHISEWADIINAHSLPGSGIVDGLKQATASSSSERGLLLLAEMSSAGNLVDAEYTDKTLKMAEANKDFVFGFISQRRLAVETNPDPFIYMTPGVKLQSGTDNLGQQYATPESAIVDRKSDIIIVGRGIYKAADKATAAEQYRAAAWLAYESRSEGVAQ